MKVLSKDRFRLDVVIELLDDSERDVIVLKTTVIPEDVKSFPIEYSKRFSVRLEQDYMDHIEYSKKEIIGALIGDLIEKRRAKGFTNE